MLAEYADVCSQSSCSHGGQPAALRQQLCLDIEHKQLLVIRPLIELDEQAKQAICS